jgi:hypothetical protein
MENIQDINNQIMEITMTKKEKALVLLKSIINRFPLAIQNIINEGFKHQRIPREYLFSSILNAFGNTTGLKVELDAMGFKNYSNIYSVIVGSRGDTKSLALDVAFDPLEKKDSDYYNVYKEKEEFNKQLEEADQENVVRQRILVKDETIENVKKVHSNNPVSVGLLQDEISGLIYNMANPNSRDGKAWLFYLLSGYTNKGDDVGRVSTEGYRMEKTCPLIIGSIQNQLIPKVFANGNLESGFVDRLLFTNLLEANYIVSKGKIPSEVKLNYKNLIDRALLVRNIEKKVVVMLSNEANEVLFNYSQLLVNRQKAVKSPLKEYMSKLNISIYKLTLIVHNIWSLAENNGISTSVHVDTVKLAIDINEFYLLNFEMILDLVPQQSIKDVNVQDVITYAKKNGLKQKDVAEFTKKDKGNISKLWKKTK